jgi:Probable sensor domain DACNV
VFPPALVPLLRDRVMAKAGSLVEVADPVLVQLLTTIFWAGLETYEGERNPIGVAFLGTSGVDVVTSDAADADAPFLYQWKVQHFQSPRPFAIGELVKLAVAGTDRRIYSAVNVRPDGSLVITGLAREGFSVTSDPFVKIIASRPGCLSIRCGRDLLLEYERGAILTGGEDVVFAAGPVRRALEDAAHAADLDDDAVPDYVDAVRSLVWEMAAHGRGGILIVSDEEWPDVAEAATYRMAVDSSVASLLRLARHLGRAKGGDRRAKTGSAVEFGSLLRNAFLTEAERLTEELGALTGIDGAILLNRHLGLVAFGVMLPLGRPTALAEAADAEGLRARVVDLGSRGTRHHAGATYAAEHPGSVVFVASEDGHVSCMFRDPLRERTLLWRLGPAEVRTR